MTINGNYVADHIDGTLGHPFAVRVALGVDGVPEPPDALDDVLGRDQRAQEARQAVQRALDDLVATEHDEASQAACKALSEGTNALVAATLDVGWKFGWTAGSGGR